MSVTSTFIPILDLDNVADELRCGIYLEYLRFLKKLLQQYSMSEWWTFFLLNDVCIMGLNIL